VGFSFLYKASVIIKSPISELGFVDFSSKVANTTLSVDMVSKKYVKHILLRICEDENVEIRLEISKMISF
jgi:hypothetical protein